MKKKLIFTLIGVFVLIGIYQTVSTTIHDDKENNKNTYQQQNDETEENDKNQIVSMKEDLKQIEGDIPQGYKYSCVYSFDKECYEKFVEYINLDLKKMRKTKYDETFCYDYFENEDEDGVSIECNQKEGAFTYIDSTSKPGMSMEGLNAKCTSEEIMKNILPQDHDFLCVGETSWGTVVYEKSFQGIPISSKMHSIHNSEEYVFGTSVQIEHKEDTLVYFKYGFNVKVQEKGVAIKLQEWTVEKIMEELTRYCAEQGKEVEVLNMRYVYMPELDESGDRYLKPMIEIETKQKDIKDEYYYFVDMENGIIYNQ